LSLDLAVRVILDAARPLGKASMSRYRAIVLCYPP
jgi:hypothetical protein